MLETENTVILTDNADKAGTESAPIDEARDELINTRTSNQLNFDEPTSDATGVATIVSPEAYRSMTATIAEFDKQQSAINAVIGTGIAEFVRNQAALIRAISVPPMNTPAFIDIMRPTIVSEQTAINSMIKAVADDAARVQAAMVNAMAVEAARTQAAMMRAVFVPLGNLQASFIDSLSNTIASIAGPQMVINNIDRALLASNDSMTANIANIANIASLSVSSTHTLLAQQLSNMFWQGPSIGIAHLLSSSFDKVSQSLRQLLITAFLRAKLWPTPSISDRLMYQIAEYAINGDIPSVTLLVWNYYARNNHARLREAVSCWWDDPEYRARRPHIEEALHAHCLGMYIASISTLMPFPEGITSDEAYQSGLVAPDGSPLKLGKTKRIIKSSIERAASSQSNSMTELKRDVMVKSLTSYINQIAFEDFDFAAVYEQLRQRKTLNRHGILHGLQLNYHSYMNSLRCFLLLDALYGMRQRQ